MKKDLGQTSYHAGLAAEEIVTRDYIERGHRVEERRYRKKSGEVDLILSKGHEIIFVEVKKSKTHALAAQSISQRQLDRIFNTAMQFLATQPMGQDTPSRIDVALVDAEGRVDCLENVYVC